MTFKELYFCNDRWDETSILTVDIQSLDSAIPRRKHLATPLHDLMVKYDDYAVEAFKKCKENVINQKGYPIPNGVPFLRKDNQHYHPSATKADSL